MSNDLIQKVKQLGNPIIEGNTVTFVWLGNTAPQLISDLNDWGWPDPFQLTAFEPGVWIYQCELPLDSYIEYAWVDGEIRVLDPHNTNITPNGMGKFNHYFSMPAYQPTDLATEKKGVPKGKISQIEIPCDEMIAGKKRVLRLYQPPTDQPCPLLVVFDGQDYFNRAKLPTIIDNMIAAGRIQPIALAMIDSHGPTRAMEYVCSDSTVGHILTNIIPAAKERLNILDIAQHPGAYGVLGASFGGLIALYSGFRMPHVFGHVFSQAGGFAVRGYPFVVWELVRYCQERPKKIYLDIGRFDFLYETNQDMLHLLKEKDDHYQYFEYNAGHNYPVWRDHLWKGLEYLYGK